ncbi:MAG: 50S ribosomal protein L21 [Actinomycetaceae bacterium]|nr:50S ribosomal protein L21 [Actinomycetaceae bacterium]
MRTNVVYAIVKAGGRQEKVSVGSILVVDKMEGNEGDKVELEPIMLVDGDKVTTAADGISAKVTAEIVDAEEKAPKISIIKYKNKTGYRKRQGHRQKLTRLKVTAIK